MGKAILVNLCYQCYVLKICQQLTDVHGKAKRVKQWELLHSSLKHCAARRMCFFSDEKIFIVERTVNRRNDRLLAYDPGEVPIT